MIFFQYFYLRCNFWLVALYSLRFFSMLVTRCKIKHYALQNLLVTGFKSCSLQKITHYFLQKLLVAKIHFLLVAKFACYSLQKLLVAKNHSLLVAKSISLIYLFLYFSILSKTLTLMNPTPNINTSTKS